MHLMKATLVAAGTLFLGLASPALAENKQYAEIQKKTIIEVIFNKQVKIEREAEAKVIVRGDTAEFRLISDKKDVRAAWVTELNPPIQAHHMEFYCRKLERGVLATTTTNPIVRVEYSSVGNSQHRFLTLPVRESSGFLFTGELSQVDGADPIIHRVAVVALQKTNVFIDDHADMLTRDLKLGIVFTKGTVELTPRVDDGSDAFINDAKH